MRFETPDRLSKPRSKDRALLFNYLEFAIEIASRRLVLPFDLRMNPVCGESLFKRQWVSEKPVDGEFVHTRRNPVLPTARSCIKSAGLKVFVVRLLRTVVLHCCCRRVSRLLDLVFHTKAFALDGHGGNANGL